MQQTNPLDLDEFIKSHPEFRSVSQEDLLDAQMSIMDEEEVHEYIKKCDDCLRVSGMKLPPRSIAEIPFTEFESLFLEATGKHLGGDKRRYITALKIFMGSQENAGIVPIFQPVYLKRMRYDAMTQKELYQIPSYGHGSFYKLVKKNTNKSDSTDNTMFEEIKEDERMKIIRNYREGTMTIIHEEGQTHTKFIQDTDVEACVFPFQTLFKLIQERTSVEETIFLTNAIREIIVDDGYENKHVFIISGEKINFEGPDKQARFANRSHLCPPCNSVDFGFDVFKLPKREHKPESDITV